MQSSFATFNPTPTQTIIIRVNPEDFIVKETLSFDLTGMGEHVYLHICKRGLTTIRVAEKLARLANVRDRDVGYAGMKDKQGETSQWFSVHLPKNPDIDWTVLNDDAINVLDIKRHERKCRVGALAHNDFCLTLRDVDNLDDILSRLKIIEQTGMPNYFGEQRFGRFQDNIDKAHALFKGELKIKNRRKRGIIYSAARSWIFNHCLSARVTAENFNQAILGDTLQLVGRRGYFSIDEVDEGILARIASHEVVPAGPLWGNGTHHTHSEASQFETPILESLKPLCEGLCEHELEIAYRPYVVFPKNIKTRLLAPKTLSLSFQLPRGAYATSLLRELIRS